jgi:hypothetical protein
MAKALVREMLVFRAQQEVGVATEIVLTKAEQASDDWACAAGLRRRELAHRLARRLNPHLRVGRRDVPHIGCAHG